MFAGVPPKGGSYRLAGVPPEGGSHRRVPPEGGRYGIAGRLVINPAWVDPSQFGGFELIEVDPDEPDAANVLAVGARVICSEAHTRTRRRLEAHGIATVAVPAGELAKAEGGVTCCSIVFATDS